MNAEAEGYLYLKFREKIYLYGQAVSNKIKVLNDAIINGGS